MRVAVIGVGGVGSAALRFLAEAGHEVVGFERHALGHARGSSHGESRIYRLAHPDALYTSLMREALPLWDALEREAGEELLVRCGCLYFGPREHPEVHAVRAAIEGAGARCEVLDASECARRFPAIRLRSDEVGVLSDGGFLRSTRCVLANAELARLRGAWVVENAVIDEVRERGDGVEVVREGRADVFDRAVVAAGAWLPALLGLRSPLTVTKQQVVYMGIRERPEAFEPSRMPVWIDAASHDYGFPSDGRHAGVKVASHAAGAGFDPDRGDRPVDLSTEGDLVDRMVRRLPWLSRDVVGALACLYTNTPDEDFVVGLVPGAKRIAFASACSGHGFKFTVLMGRTVARVAVGEEPGIDLSRFAIERFM